MRNEYPYFDHRDKEFITMKDREKLIDILFEIIDTIQGYGLKETK